MILQSIKNKFWSTLHGSNKPQQSKIKKTKQPKLKLIKVAVAN